MDASGRKVVELYEEGVAALLEAGGRIEDDGRWEEQACGSWTARQTVAHVAIVAGWYHDWLDCALAGETSSPFPAKELDRRNARAVEAAEGLSGPEALDRFGQAAGAHLARAQEHRDLAYGFPFGTVTVGLHLGVAATEWHLHAWDLDRTHAPEDPAALFTAAGECVAATKPRLQQAILRRLIPMGARRAPWPAILRRSGRGPADAAGR